MLQYLTQKLTLTDNIWSSRHTREKSNYLSSEYLMFPPYSADIQLFHSRKSIQSSIPISTLLLSTMTIDKDTTDDQSTTGTGTGTGTCGLNCDTDNLCCGLGLNRSDGSEIPGTEGQLLRNVGEGDEENQGMYLEPGSQGFLPSKEEMASSGEEPSEYEIVLNDEEEETEPKNGLRGVFGGGKSKSSLAAAATEESSELGLGGNVKRGNVAVIETDDTLEAQTVDGDISIIDCNGNATRVTLVEKPRSRRRLYILLALLCLAMVCAIAALLVALLKDGTKEDSFESSFVENDEDGDVTGDENVGTDFGDKASLTTGCFQYTEGFLVCLSEEGANDGLCSATMDGEACASCTVCDAERGTVRVDCSNAVEDLLVINDECIDTADAFDNTLLEAFLVGNDGGFEGSFVDLAGQGKEDGDQGEEEGATDVPDDATEVPDDATEAPDDVTEAPDDVTEAPTEVPDALEANYTTGCFDYNFRLNTGAVVCLSDEDPSDDICSISVNGQACDSCTVCDRDAGTVQVDCTNLDYSPVINDACSSDNSVYQGTLLEAFMGGPEDANTNDGGWINATEVPEDGDVCVTMIESDYKCYAIDTSVDVRFVSCEFESDDWIGIFPDTADPLAVGTPANSLWVWACNGDTEDCDLTTQSDIYTFTGLEVGSYRAMVIRRNVDGPDEAYSWSDAFEVKDNASDCDFR